jgi:glycolate oxidase FAD binding subunit
METFYPANPSELAEALKEAANGGAIIEIAGNRTKTRCGGCIEASHRVSLRKLSSALIYEPKDLTVSVEAGMTYASFRDMLAHDGYMVPLDPPFAEDATIGGVIASNGSGPRRRMYGTARDLVIGMQFATLEGKLVQTGGMVVKNVAGLDMGKLMIGSLGTLAAIASINFKLIPKPFGSKTFWFEYGSAREALSRRDEILRGVLQPVAVDLLNPAASGRKKWLLAVGVNGNQAVLDRYTREFGAAESIDGRKEREFWATIEEAISRHVNTHPEGCVVRTSLRLNELATDAEKLPGEVIIRAGNGVCYSMTQDAAQAKQALAIGKSVIEYGPVSRTKSLEMWPVIDSGFAMMRNVKNMFDPKNLLNPGRLYGRI